MALRFGDLAYGLGIWLFIRHALLRPSGAGGGFKRSTHSASPGLDYQLISLSIGLADQLINLKVWSGKPFGVLLVSLRGLLVPLGVSWRPLGNFLGRSLADLGASWPVFG